MEDQHLLAVPKEVSRMQDEFGSSNQQTLSHYDENDQTVMLNYDDDRGLPEDTFEQRIHDAPRAGRRSGAASGRDGVSSIEAKTPRAPFKTAEARPDQK